jgi:zinc protease
MRPVSPRPRLRWGLAVLVLFAAACTPAPKPIAMPEPVLVPGGTPSAEPAAPPAAARAERVREIEGISEYRLPNGLQILLFPDETKSTITVNMTYFVGSRHEGYGESGMAHLLEHLTFKGTRKYPDLDGELNRRGAFSNGTTWTDRTNYFETLPASSDNLAFAIDLEADRMRSSLLRAEDLATEFSVVRNEFERGENDPYGVLIERVTSAAYLWHNYGKSTIGSRSDIERVPLENLKAFYDRFYQPDNAMLVVAGKFEPDEALRLIERSYGAIPRPSRVLADSYTIEPVQDGERTVTLRRNGDVHLLLAAYHTVAGADPDFPAILAAADLLTREPSGRLYGPLVKSKLASAVFGYAYAWREPGLVVFGAQVRDRKHLPAVKKQLLAAIEGLGRTKITDEEVERFKSATLKNIELRMADSQRVAIELSEWAAKGDWRLLFAHRAQVRGLKAADVQRVAATWLKASNRTWGELIPTATPDRTPLAVKPDVASIAETVQGGEVETGEAFVASLDNLEARTQVRKLAGGIDAAFLAKKTRGGKVQLQLTLRHGDLASLQGKDLLGDATAQLVQRGTRRRSYQQLEDDKDRLKASVMVWGTAGSITVRIETVRDSLLEALDLAAEMLTAPAFPADELEVVRQQQLASLEDATKDPNARGFTELQRTMQPWGAGDPRRYLTHDEQIARWKKIKVADLKAYHRDFFGAGKGELAVVGDFEADALAARVEQHFGRWLARKPYRRLEGKRFDVAATARQIDIKDKEMAFLAVGHDLDLRDDDPEYPAAQLAGFIAGGGSSSRLFNRLREKEGWSYGAAAWLSASPFDRVGGFTGYAILAPQNLDKARAALVEELRLLADQGVDAAELDKMRSSWLEQDLNALANDRALMSRLAGLLYTGRSLAHVREQHAKVRALTPAQVSAAAKKYIVPARLIIVEAADHAKAKEAAAAGP